jgi:hypothetical protein
MGESASRRNEKQNMFDNLGRYESLFLMIGVLGPFPEFSTDGFQCGSYPFGRVFGRNFTESWEIVSS